MEAANQISEKKNAQQSMERYMQKKEDLDVVGLLNKFKKESDNFSVKKSATNRNRRKKINQLNRL